ncbi:hypothetical protein XM75_c10144 [Vibrio vulnificus]|nr:hypothetical protein [Vibrio parahaemolyticus]OQK55077.1 hypothetical protein XM75_c10144 [Vibrio vulnificus]
MEVKVSESQEVATMATVATPATAREALAEFEAQHGAELAQCPVLGCVTWEGRVRPMWNHKGIRMPLYRWACLAAHNESVCVGENRVARHKCDNEKCFNPKHLHWGTRGENNGDRAL